MQNFLRRLATMPSRCMSLATRFLPTRRPFWRVAGGEKARESGDQAALFFPFRVVERCAALSLASLRR